MKKLTEPEKTRGANAWGAASMTIRQRFLIEPADVGRIRENYRGYEHSSYKFCHGDVDRVIEVLTDDSYWTCWVFVKHADSLDT